MNRRKITHSGLPDEVIRQKKWTESELRAMGYEYYTRIKEVTMARQLPAEEAPKKVITIQGDELIAEAGYMICYHAGENVFPLLDSYVQWPVSGEIFQQTYKRWDEPDWQPSPAEKKLMDLGCEPYYKATGVWAKKLETDAYLQSLEHPEPVKIRTGQYVAIGIKGEPYSMGPETLHERYQVKTNRLFDAVRRLVRRLRGMG